MKRLTFRPYIFGFKLCLVWGQVGYNKNNKLLIFFYQTKYIGTFNIKVDNKVDCCQVRVYSSNPLCTFCGTISLQVFSALGSLFLDKPGLCLMKTPYHNTPAGTAFTDCGNFSILRSYEYFYDAGWYAGAAAVDFDERFLPVRFNYCFGSSNQ